MSFTTQSFAAYDLLTGPAASLPASVSPGSGRLAIYQASDTGTTYIWSGGAAKWTVACAEDYMSSTIPISSAIGLTSAMAANVTSLVLPAGDWDVSANNSFTGGDTTVVQELDGGVSLVSATLPATGGIGRTQNSYGTAGLAVFLQNNMGFVAGPVRVTGPTTAYLVAYADFNTSTCAAYGEIIARRVT